MSWNSWIGSESALHIESGEKFAVSYYSRNVQTIDDIGLVPVPGSKRKWTSEELLNLKQELWEHWEDERRRRELFALVEGRFLGENSRVAYAISSVTGKSVSARSLQSWLIDSSKPSSRKCPVWALKALQDYLNNPKNAKDLEEYKKYRSEIPKENNRFEEIHNKRGVEMATRAIEDDQRALALWRKADFNTLPIKLFELEKQIEGYQDSLGQRFATVINALDRCENFEDFKKLVRKEMTETDYASSALRRIRKSIEQGTGEFSNEEGLDQ